LAFARGNSFLVTTFSHSFPNFIRAMLVALFWSRYWSEPQERNAERVYSRSGNRLLACIRGASLRRAAPQRR
jgi:hypothetical protein